MLFLSEIIKIHISTNMPMFLKTTNLFYLSHPIEVSTKNLKFKTSTLNIFPSRLSLLQDFLSWLALEPSNHRGERDACHFRLWLLPVWDIPSVSVAGSSREHGLCGPLRCPNAVLARVVSIAQPLSPSPTSPVSSVFLTSSPTLSGNIWGVNTVERTKS